MTPAGYYRHAATIATILVAIVATRVHEVIPILAPLRPAILSGVVGTLLIVWRSRPLALRNAIRDPV
ncbi:MAG TPA: hypothetical protein VF178_12070, partial [Gemmatimonadaceae bacterium]